MTRAGLPEPAIVLPMASKAKLHRANTASVAESMATGAIAPAMAAVVTNPADVAKTRLNMARELQKGRIGGVVECWRKIFAAEGLAGLQRGLGFVLIRESTKNAFRLGLFEPIVCLLDGGGAARGQVDGGAAMSTRVAAGAISGGLAAALCNPLDLLKTRIQLDPSRGAGSAQRP